MNAAVTAYTQRLLIVDDHPVFAEGLKAILEQVPFASVHIAHSAREALRQIQLLPPDLVLLDLTLPDSCPFQLAEEMLRIWPCLGVLFLDDRVRVPKLRAALRTKACGYWTKQSSSHELMEGLRAAIQGRASFCPAVRALVVPGRHGLRYQAPKDSPLARLSSRESQVLALLREGLSVKHCAQRLNLSRFTVENHKARLMKKLGVHKSTQLVMLAAREGW